MKAASAFAKITPRGEFYLVGYFNDIRKLPAVGIHDDPYVNLMLIETGNSKLLFIAIDVCIVSKGKIDPIKLQLAEKLRIPYENITVNSIHSHSCANGFDDGGISPKDNPEYLKYVTGIILNTALSLPEKMVEVKAEYLKTNVRDWYSNRSDKTKAFDDEAIIIRFRSKDEQVIGAFLNFNCHATVVGPFNRYLTTDIIGEVRRNLTGFVGIMPYTFTGASGDLGNRQFRQGNDFNELLRVGAGIANEIKKGSFQPISMEGFELRLFDYHVSYDNSKHYKEYQAKLDEVRNALASDKLTDDEKKLAVTEELLLNKKLTTKSVDFHVVCKIMTIGDVQAVTFPGELGSIFGMQIKKNSRAVLPLVIGYADDYNGYFVSAEDYGKTYESMVSDMIEGETEKMIDKLKDCL